MYQINEGKSTENSSLFEKSLTADCKVTDKNASQMISDGMFSDNFDVMGDASMKKEAGAPEEAEALKEALADLK